MRLLHTSDWHLGRRLCDASLLEDQAHALDQVFLALREEKCDALVVAGDVYDRAVPPEDAVRLLSEFLLRVRRDLAIPAILISGNHDSAERLGFGAALLEAGGVHVRTGLVGRERPVPVGDGPEAGLVWCLPYCEPAAARHALAAEPPLPSPSIDGHDAAVRAVLAHVHREREARRVQNSVLVGHLLALGGEESPDSERPLVVGGAAAVSLEALEGFAYVALGHLHRPQRVGGRETVRYSGSLLTYAFAETGHPKGVTVVEVERGAARVRELALSPRRDVVRLTARFEELLHDPRFGAAEGAYVEAVYTDTDFLVDTKARLRERFPHLLSVRPALLDRVLAPASAGEAGRAARLDDAGALLDGFWAHVHPDVPLSAEQRAAFEAYCARALEDAPGATAPAARAGTPAGSEAA